MYYLCSPIRSDLRGSKINLVVDVTRHGEPSQPAKYQDPKIGIEHLYADCDVVDIEKKGSDKRDGTNQHGKSSSVSRYQQPRKTSEHAKSDSYPRTVSRTNDTLLSNQEGDASNSFDYQYPNPERAYIDMSLRKETKVPTGSMVTSANHQLGEQCKNNEEYQHPSVDQQSNPVVQPGYEESSTTNHDQFDAYGIMSEYQHPRVDQQSNSVVQPGYEESSTSSHDQFKAYGMMSDYQHPKPSNEHTRRESSRLEQDGNSVLLPSELLVPLTKKHRHAQDESSRAPSEYQHPKPSIEHTGSENSADQKKNSVTPSKCGPTPRKDHVAPTVDKRKEDTPSKPPRYFKPSAVPPKAPSHYTTSSPPPTKLAPPSVTLIAPPPLSDLSTEDKSRADNYQRPDVKFWTSESGDHSDKNETGSIDILSSQGESLPTASTSQSPSPSLSDDRNSSCEKGYQMPKIPSEFIENEGYSLPESPRGVGNVESNLDYHIPEVDPEFLESNDKSLIHPSTSPPVLLKKSPSAKPSTAPTTSTPPALPARSLSQKSSRSSKFSTSSEPPGLPPKTSSLKFPRIRQTTETSGLSPPALPSKAPPQKSPSATCSSPPALPPRKQSVKSPEIEAPQSPMPPPVPPKAAPLLPAETKPVSPPPSTQYAKLNELHRQDDDSENYQHLIPMQNIK